MIDQPMPRFALSLRDTMSTPLRPSPRPRRTGLWIAAAILLVASLAGLGLLGLRIADRLEAIDSRLAELEAGSLRAAEASEHALERAEQAERFARAAAEGRLEAEAVAARAEQDASASREDAELARREAERVRLEAEAELNRLEDALGKIAETRRTALGLVMNLGEESIKFEFDDASLKTADRELLSRIAGILLTSEDYSVYVNGHTDDVGSASYNQKLSERRARAVRDYLVQAGIDERIMTVEGKGKTQPIAAGTSSAARAKNRRVELGIVNARVRYPHASRR